MGLRDLWRKLFGENSPLEVYKTPKATLIQRVEDINILHLEAILRTYFFKIFEDLGSQHIAAPAYIEERLQIPFTASYHMSEIKGVSKGLTVYTSFSQEGRKLKIVIWINFYYQKKTQARGIVSFFITSEDQLKLKLSKFKSQTITVLKEAIMDMKKED